MYVQFNSVPQLLNSIEGVMQGSQEVEHFAPLKDATRVVKLKNLHVRSMIRPKDFKSHC